MAAILEELTIDATLQRVYNALTQQDEIMQWWAYEAQVKHDGFTQIDEQAARAWIFFLASLKSYLETGKGTPGTPPGFN